MPKKVDTAVSPLTGKGLCAPVVASSLLSKSNTGSISVFRAALAGLNPPCAISSMGPHTCYRFQGGIRRNEYHRRLGKGKGAASIDKSRHPRSTT